MKQNRITRIYELLLAWYPTKWTIGLGTLFVLSYIYNKNMMVSTHWSQPWHWSEHDELLCQTAV